MRSHLAPRRAEERERSACPDEDADVESLGELGEQIPKDKSGSPSRTSAKSGEKYQPVTCT